MRVRILRSKVLSILVFIILALLITITEAYSASPPQILVNQNIIQPDVKPYLDKNRRTMVPLRFVSEGMGFKISWNESNGEATVLGNDAEIILKPGSKEAFLNGKVKILESEPIKRNNRVMVPLRFIAETLGAIVNYNQVENLISITVGNKVKPIYYREKVIVLLYHHIDSKINPSTITPDTFSSHLDMLERKGFNVIPIFNLKKIYQNPAGLPPNAVVITFDDGYESFYTYAYPELVKRKMVATNFLIVGRIGNKTGEIPKLDWEQVQEMQGQGMSFFSHTFDSHYYAPTKYWGSAEPVFSKPIYLTEAKRMETETEYVNRVVSDFKMAKDVLEAELGGERDMFAIPYGWYNTRVLKMAEQVGYKYIFSINSGINDKGTKATRLRRVNAGHPDLSAEMLENEIWKLIRY